MKLNRSLLFPLLISVFSLASCGPEKNKSSSSTDSDSTVSSSTTSSSTTGNRNEFGQILYDLTITGQSELVIRGPFRPSTDIQHTEYSFPEGAWVIFVVEIVENAEVVATLNGEKLESYQQIDTGLYFQFSMPGQDSVLDISVK